jgi:hypothetical protein
MPTRRYATETVEADLEESTEFTEADLESLEFAPEDLEELEFESTESLSLEDVDPESVAESLESFMEGEESNGYGSTPYGSGSGRNRRSPGRSVSRQLVKSFTIIIQRLVKKIMSNPKTRAKLQAAIRKGPTAVTRVLMPSVNKLLPSYFRWMAPIYVPRVARTLFDPMRNQAGVKVEELEEALEWE